MKNTIKLIVMACAAAVMLTACASEGVTPAVDNSTPASSAAVSSQNEATSAPQQIDDDNNAPYTVIYKECRMGDWGDIMCVTAYTNDKYEEGLFATHIEVADTYDGKPVEGVYQMAFRNRKDLKSVVLPDSIKVLGDEAFKYCESLESITLPANLTQIQNQVFQYCFSLENITLPDTLEVIDRVAFDGCEKINVTYKGETYDYAHIKDLYKAVNGE